MKYIKIFPLFFLCSVLFEAKVNASNNSLIFTGTIVGSIVVALQPKLSSWKSYVASEFFRRSYKDTDLKKDFSWLETNYDLENYQDGTPDILLKNRKQLEQGYKEILQNLQQKYMIKDTNFINYLIIRSEDTQKNVKRKRFVDSHISGEFLNFIDKTLSKVHIDPSRIDIYSLAEPSDENEIITNGSTETITSWVLEKIKHEKLYLNQERINALKSCLLAYNIIEELILDIHKEFLEEKITTEEKLKRIKALQFASKYFFYIVAQERYSLYSTILHEIGHIVARHSITTQILISHINFQLKDFMDFGQYKEFMADSLLPLLYKKAAKIRLIHSIISAINITECEKMTLSLGEEDVDKKYMSDRLKFILFTDIARLHNISLHHAIEKSFKKIRVDRNIALLNSTYNNIQEIFETIYDAANPEFYIQTYKNKDGTEETFKFPRFLPNLLEK